MTKGFFLAVGILALSFLWAWPLFSAKSDPFPEQSEHEAYNSNDDYVGTIKKESGRLVFLDKDSITLEKTSTNLWKLYNREHDYVGKLVGEKLRFRLYDKSGGFTGFIINVNERGGTPFSNSQGGNADTFRDEFVYVSTVTDSPRIRPEEAKLYLCVMEAIK